jgi:hypothetical protein
MNESILYQALYISTVEQLASAKKHIEEVCEKRSMRLLPTDFLTFAPCNIDITQTSPESGRIQITDLNDTVLFDRIWAKNSRNPKRLLPTSN